MAARAPIVVNSSGSAPSRRTIAARPSRSACVRAPISSRSRAFELAMLASSPRVEAAEALAGSGSGSGSGTTPLLAARGL